MAKTRNERAHTLFGHYRQVVPVLALLALAVPSKAQNYFIATPQPGINAVDTNVGTNPPLIYALYGSFLNVQSIYEYPTALQLNVPVGTGIIQAPDSPGTPLSFQITFFDYVPGPLMSEPFTISGGASWAVVDSPLTGDNQVECDFSVCETGGPLVLHVDATGLAVGTYVATFTQSQLFTGTFQIVLNVLPSGVTNPYIPPPPPRRPAGPELRSKDGDPVDLSSGLFIYRKTDLAVDDVLPVRITRTYRQPDVGVSRAFGLGATHPYDMFVYYTGDFSAMTVALPDGRRINYVRTSGTTYSNSILKAQASPGEYFESTITWNGQGWNLALKDGTVYAFGQDGPLQSIQDRYRNKITITRDASGNITKITSPDGRWIQFTNDTNNRISQLSDNIGRTVSYTYDSNGMLSTVNDAESGTTSYTYDANGNMLTITDPRGIVYLTNQYDSQGRVTLQTQADSSTFQFAYLTDANNNITQTNVTDPRGNVRQVTFDANGYTLADTVAVGKSEQQATTYTRQSGNNLLLSFTDALNRQTSYGYDAMGNVASATNLAGTPNAVTSSFTYDPIFNQLTSITDALNHTTSFAYDSNGNLITVTDPLNNQSQFTYNSEGQLLTGTDALGHTTQFAYDSGDLVSVTDALRRTTNRFVDAAGRLTSVINPLGQVTKYAYDNFNQISSVTDPLNGTTSFTYDPNGNLLSVADANSHTTSYSYDNMDRLATRTDPLGSTESNQYDGDGNLTQFTDRRGKVTTYNYDALNRRTFAGFGTQSGPTYESTIGYTYDAGNRLTQAVDSVTGTVTRGYDGLDRLTSETTPEGSISNTYDAASRRTSMTVAGQTAVNYFYDNANRLTSIVQGNSALPFAYDAANRRTSLTLPNGIVMSYSYDNASHLTGIGYQFGQNSLGNLSYAYDPAGRRTSIGGSLAAVNLPNAVSTTAYNANNQLTQWGTATPTYDANGNMLSDGTNTYVWNARNQLASMNLTGETFQYDSFGRRAAKTVVNTTTNYLYDASNPVQELSGTTPTANLLTGGVDEYFTRTDSTGTASFLTDALGSTISLTNSSGGALASYTYEPFGNTTITGFSTNSYQYTGRENDGTGVYYYRARYYSPTLQRFISEDPIALKGGDINFYRYARDNPISLTDPLGLSTFSLTGSINVQWGPVTLNYSGGFSLDTHGNIAVINTGGGGGGFGAHSGIGVNGSVSNAPNVCGLGGWFGNVSGAAGLGLDAGANGFGGVYKGQAILGGGVTLGAGAGLGSSTTATYTSVTPFVGRKDHC